jgi:hypothetical protein
MSCLITTEERLKKANELIQKARQLPAGIAGTFLDLTYVAQVKDILRQARDLIKFIPFSPSADVETKQTVKNLMWEIEETKKRPQSGNAGHRLSSSVPVPS